MRTVTYRLADLSRAVIPLGFVGENQHTRVIFDASKVFAEYPAAVPALTVQPPQGTSYPAVVVRDGDYVLFDVSDSDLIHAGTGELQLAFVQDAVHVRTFIARTRIDRSIVPTGEIPEPLEDFLEAASAAVAAIPQEVADGVADGFGAVTAEAETLAAGSSATAEFNGETKKLTIGVPVGDKGDQGDPGADGFSPVASVSKSGDTATISITDKTGTTTATVKDGTDGQDGQPGADGYSPSASVSKSGATATITITDKSGTTTATVSDGTPVIDDTTTTATDKVWSAKKSADTASDLNNEIDAKYTKPQTGIPEEDIADGVIPDPEDLIDDIAGSGVTNKTWSANKLAELEAFVDMGTFSPAQLQKIVADGKANQVFSIGDIIYIPWTNYTPSTPVSYDFPFVVAHIGDAYDEQNVKHENALYLMAMYAEPEEIPFDAAEGVVVDLSTEPNALEGWYYFGISDNTWTALNLSTGDTIPTTYGSVQKTWCNQSGVARYGYNRYSKSAYRQWLNSDAGKNVGWWTAQHEHDIAPAASYTNKPGWMYGFTPEWKAIFKKVKVQTSCNTVTDGGVTDITYDKFFLPSLEQVYGNPQIADVEGPYWEYWKQKTGLDSPSNGSSTDTNDGRKIPSMANPSGAAVYCRLRSAYRGYSYYTWVVYSTGYLASYYAYGSLRSQPACVIY